MNSTIHRSSSILRFNNHFLHNSTSRLLHSSVSAKSLSSLLQGSIPRPHLLQVHALVFRADAHQDNLVATRLIGHYPSSTALRVFNQLQSPNIFPFNAIIRVFAEKGPASDAISLFKDLKRRFLPPNDFTFSFILKACFRDSSPKYVRQIHTHILKNGFCEDPVVCNGLLSVYAKGLKDLVSARKVFDEFPERNLVCHWTSLIAGCAKSRRSEDALLLFVDILKEHLRPENDTMVNVLSACSSMEVTRIEKWVNILLSLLNDANFEDAACNSINTVLAFLYGKWGRIKISRERFEEITHEGRRTVLPWNVMISSYVQNGCPVEAINLFSIMVEDRTLSPNHVTMVSVLSACAQVGGLELGRFIHNHIKSKSLNKLIGSNTILGTSLIDMYSKCGHLDEAKDVFNQMAYKDIISYNAMIMGFAVNGKSNEALELFDGMKRIGLKPNSSTFLAALSACCHAGLSKSGKQIFSDMMPKFSVSPNLEHYACYIDLLSRVGHLEEALEVVSSMPFEPNNVVWGALLSGCLVHGRVEEARCVSRKLVEVDPENSGGYVMMANTFAGDQQWRRVSAMRGVMRERGVKKQPGHSWVSIDGSVHEFRVASKEHPRIHAIYQTLFGLMKTMRASP